MVDPDAEKSYVPFMVNRGLSYFADTVLYANEMNMTPSADKKMQFDFLRYGIRKRKRFSKWAKKTVADDAKLIAEYYGYSIRKAEQVVGLHTPEQLKHMKQVLSKGGKKR